MSIHYDVALDHPQKLYSEIIFSQEVQTTELKIEIISISILTTM